MQKGEDNLVEWIAARIADTKRTDVLIDIGDDMAHLSATPDGWLASSDMLMDGVDFDAAVHTPEQIGRKAIAVNLSDCAAMAVEPRFVLVSVALNEAWSMDQARRLFEGIKAIADEFGCRIVGGDTNSWSYPLVIDVTILARPYPGIPPIRRSGARVGDEVYVTGPLGGSLAGHHLTFVPRVAAAKALAGLLGADLHAMMDLSDGLSTDGHRLARASSCGILLDRASVEKLATQAARDVAAAGRGRVLDHVLNDGEDFELLLIAAPGRIDRLAATPGDRLRHAGLDVGYPRKIGEIVSGHGVFLQNESGNREPVPPGGWQHFR